MESNDNSMGIWAALVWTALALGVVAIIALYSTFPG
jgi:heme exporter protein D